MLKRRPGPKPKSTIIGPYNQPISYADAAEYLGVSVATITHRLRAHRLKGRRLVTLQSLRVGRDDR